MIRGLAGLKLASMITGVQKPFRPARGLQPLPGMDTLHISKQGQTLAAAGLTVTVNIRPSAGTQTYQALPAVDAKPVPAEPSMVDRMRAAMFAAKGDDGYDAGLDFDGNGRINFADMKRYLAGADSPAIRPAEPAPAQSALERMRAAFFSSSDDAGFDASADLNGDGRVNFADAALLRNGGATRPAEPTPADTATRMREAFFATKSDAGFDAELDLNNDGVINFADLQVLRNGVAPPPAPVVPAAPVTDELDVSAAAPVDAPAPGDTDNIVDSVRAAFFANAGDAAFNARADVNADGRVDFRDLAALRDRG